MLEQMGIDPDSTTNAFNTFKDEFSNGLTLVEDMQMAGQQMGASFSDAFGQIVSGSKSGKEALKEAKV